MDIVEILITGKNMSKAAFGEARADGESFGKTMGGVGIVAGAALVGIGVAAVKMATTYQTSTTRLVTSAGESVKNIDMVRKGMLTMAGQVGVSAEELSKAMYYVEAAGFHAGDGLTVLRAAAQGAAAEGANTTDVAKALTDVLVDYHMKASDAAKVTSQMGAAISHGKVNLEDFAKSFSNIIPAAAASGISFADAAGALAEMTNHGVTAQRASMNLAQALRSLVHPTGTMEKAFKTYGVSSVELSQKLHGPNGLTDAMEYISQAAAKFAKVGSPEYVAAVRSMMGTAPGMQVALMTTGQYFDETTGTIKSVGAASADASGKVKGFALVQQTLGQQIKQINAGFDAMMIRLGTALIPTLSHLISLVQGGATPVMKAFGEALSGIASGFSGPKAAAAIVAPAGRAGKLQAGAGSNELPAPKLTAWQQVGKTLAGIVANIRTFIGDLVESLRNLLPVAEQVAKILGGALLVALKMVGSFLAGVLGPALKAFTGFLAQNKTLVTDLVAAFVIWKVVSAAAAVQQAILNAVMDANPISLIILAIAALVLGVIYCYEHFKVFRDVINDAFNVVKIAAGLLAIAAINYFKFMLDVWMTVAGGILHGAAMAFGWIPGLGGQLKEADKSFQGLKAAVDRSLNGALTTVHGFVDGANKTLAGIQNKTVTITFHGVATGITPPSGSSYQSTTGFAYASGGIVSAAASGGVRSGLVQVGERGPELVKLPTGSTVYSNSQSRAMAAGGGGDVRVVLEIHSSGSYEDNDLVNKLRKAVRIRGGNVQKALGAF
jgi:TP901 family phage tail tape measure protein